MRGHRIFKQQAVFRFLDGTELRADQLHVVLFEHTAVSQLDCKIQRRLSAEVGSSAKTWLIEVPSRRFSGVERFAAASIGSMRMISSR